MKEAMTVGAREDVRIIRPAAILDERAAAQVLQQLRRLDVSAGGVWNATSSLWQRYDAPWDGVGGTRGEAKLLGSIAVMYDSPHRHEITIYKVTVTRERPGPGLDRREPVRRRADLGRPHDRHLPAGPSSTSAAAVRPVPPRERRPAAPRLTRAAPVRRPGRGGPGPGRRPAGRPRRTPRRRSPTR